MEMNSNMKVQHSFRFSSDPLLLSVKSLHKLEKKLAVQNSGVNGASLFL
jgi:hypothetical protein